MNTSTPAKVPIMDIGFLGENSAHVKHDIIKKYAFAARLNWKSNDRGAQEKIVYFVVRTRFDKARCVSGRSAEGPPKRTLIFSGSP